MKGQTLLDNPNYTPAKFVDWLVHKVFKCKTDMALAAALGVHPPVICKIRHRVRPVGDSILIRVHDLTGMPIKEIREKMGIRVEAAEVSQ